MRGTLKVVGLAALVFVWGITLSAFYGSHRLPDRIPTHFDMAGRVTGWGSPGMLWLLPVIVTSVYALMTWVTRFPGAFNYPVAVTAANRPLLQSITCDMIAWLKAELVCLFAFIQWAIVESARAGRSILSPAAIPAAILVIWGTIAWYIVAMRRVARTRPRV